MYVYIYTHPFPLTGVPHCPMAASADFGGWCLKLVSHSGGLLDLSVYLCPTGQTGHTTGGPAAAAATRGGDASD